MSDINIPTEQPIGYLEVNGGLVEITSSTGQVRTAGNNDVVFFGDVIRSIGDSSGRVIFFDGEVEIIDFGPGDVVEINEENYNLDELESLAQDAAAEASLLQAAILEGEDPSVIQDPTAAGEGLIDEGGTSNTPTVHRNQNATEYPYNKSKEQADRISQQESFGSQGSAANEYNSRYDQKNIGNKITEETPSTVKEVIDQLTEENLSISVEEGQKNGLVTVVVKGVSDDAVSVTVTFTDGTNTVKVTLNQPDSVTGEWVFENVDLSGLTDGEISITATVTDSSGNVTDISVDTGLEVDDTPLGEPTLSLVGDTSNDGIFNKDELGLDGKATVKISLPLGFDVSSDTLTVEVGGHLQKFTASEIATGAVTVEVGAGELVKASVKDVAGNVSTVSETPVVVDLSADDQGDALSIVVADTITKDVATVTVQGVDDDAQSVTVTFVNGDKSEKVTLTHNELTAGKWVFTDTDLSSLGSGDVNIIATVTDKAGNTAEVTLNAGLEVDVTPLNAPTLSLVGDTSNDGIFNYDELGTDGKATVKISLPLGFDVSSDALTVEVGGQEQSFTTSEIATGAVTVEVGAGELVKASVKDAAGNVSTVSERPVVVDLSADDQGDALSIVVADTITKDVATLTVQGVDGDAQSVTVKFINGVKFKEVTLTHTELTAGKWVFTDTDLTSLDDGNINIIAMVTDKAGNTAEVTLNAGVVLDTQAFGLPTLSLVGDTSNDGIFNYDELGTDGKATVKITLPLGFDVSNDSLTVEVAGHLQNFTTSEIATGAVTVEVGAGELVKASVKDAAGNVSTISESPVTVDLSADDQGDALSIVVADTITKDVATVTVQGVDEDAQSVTVTFVNGD
ncbi:Ig-like domain-containing protein, partial [Marinomonas dokdonensis]|uniref:Ig-like domain-containing protein n=1 Tax=Marinomonas dokdonensis TaxID=328224 RepID=UPI004055707E